MNIIKIEDMKEEGNYLKAVIYGTAGCGKTHFLRFLPRPLLILDWDGKYQPLLGEKDIDIIPYRLEKDEDSKNLIPQQWRDIQAIRKEGKYKTLVLDSITSFNRAIERWAVIMSGKGKGAGDRATIQEYGDIKRYYNTFFPSLAGISSNVILLAHEQARTDDRGNLLRIRPLITGSMGDELSSIFPSTFYLDHIPGANERWRLYYQAHQKYLGSSSTFSGGPGYIEYKRGENGYEKLKKVMEELKHT